MMPDLPRSSIDGSSTGYRTASLELDVIHRLSPFGRIPEISAETQLVGPKPKPRLPLLRIPL